MGSSGYEESKQDNQYICTKCNLMPEIININSEKGIIEFKCNNHGTNKLGIKEYLIKLTSKYKNDPNNTKCSIHSKNNYNYCYQCNISFCPNDNIKCGHKIEKIKQPKNNDFEELKKKKDLLVKSIEIKESIIKLIDIMISIYEKNQINYYNCMKLYFHVIISRSQ